MFSLVAFGAIGFIDDWAKITKQRNMGLSAKGKFGFANAGGGNPHHGARMDARPRPVLYYSECPVFSSSSRLTC